MNKKFCLKKLSTYGLNPIIQVFELSDGSLIKCNLIDTGGQERYRAINSTYYKKADIVLLMYDICNKKSFDEITSYYIDNIKENCKKDIPVVLVGNKVDKENDEINPREVFEEQGIELAKKEGYDFIETSCKTNYNVANTFESLIESWHEKQNERLARIERFDSLRGLSRKSTKDSCTKTKTFTQKKSKELNNDSDDLDLNVSTITLHSGRHTNNSKNNCCNK